MAATGYVPEGLRERKVERSTKERLSETQRMHDPRKSWGKERGMCGGGRVDVGERGEGSTGGSVEIGSSVEGLSLTLTINISSRTFPR